MPENPTDDPVVRFTTSPAFAWWIRNVATWLDPLLFRWSNGRFFSMGPATPMMLSLTMRGRKSGKLRTVQLASVEWEGARLVVASAMGQARHPGWRYNLEADPDVEVQVRGERYRAVAELLSDPEKLRAWPRVLEQLPQIRVYAERTDRDIRVFRLRRV